MTQERRGATLIVRVAGVLDVGTAATFRAEVDAAFAPTICRRLVLNLSRVTFMDSTGLGAVLGRVRKAQEAGREMALVPPPGVPRALLDTVALARAVPLYRTERAALAEGAEAHA